MSFLDDYIIKIQKILEGLPFHQLNHKAIHGNFYREVSLSFLMGKRKLSFKEIKITNQPFHLMGKIKVYTVQLL